MKATFSNVGSPQIGAVYFMTLHVGRYVFCAGVWKWRIDLHMEKF